MPMIRTFRLILGFEPSVCLPDSSLGYGHYEESLKQLAEGVIVKAVKAKKQRLAFLDFTDSKGNATPLGQFLAEEVGAQVLGPAN